MLKLLNVLIYTVMLVLALGCGRMELGHQAKGNAFKPGPGMLCYHEASQSSTFFVLQDSCPDGYTAQSQSF
jgi:hypothetical protein